MKTALRYFGRCTGRLGIVLICQFAHLAASLWMVAAAFKGNDRYWRIAKGYDRVGNAATGGMDTETVSSRANRARAEKRRWGCVLCRVLDWIEEDHCSKSAGI